MKQSRFLFTFMAWCLGFWINGAEAQQYKFRQLSSLMSMKSETTVYVKGMRKRTEAGAMMMGMPTPPVTIEQCDLQRTIKLNDKKKLYFIEPFNKDEEDLDQETPTPPVKTKTPVKQAPPRNDPSKAVPQKGGIITSTYAIIDTGERKMMHGFNARHIWTVRKMSPSPDACTMKDSMVIKTDGWYIDLPKFNCPVRSRPSQKMLQQMQRPQANPDEREEPTCKDSFVSHQSGKGKLGFILQETKTMKMGNNTQKSEFTTSIETLEFSTAKLDSMLFEIPPGYTEVKDEAELKDKMNMAEMMKEAMSNNKMAGKNPMQQGTDEKQAGGIRIGVYAPTGDDQVDAAELQTYFASLLSGGKVDAVAISSGEDAAKQKCDYTLTTTFTKIKSGGKLGGMLKALKNADPDAMSSFTIVASLELQRVSDGGMAGKEKIDGKYDGKLNEAAKRALEDGKKTVLKLLK
ncbi:MAG: hypothetical protein ABIX01_21255 [Chitinophagaceae bacterium]